MNILVDSDQTFPVELRFTLITNSEGVVTGIQIVDDPNVEADCLICSACGRDFDTMSKIMEDSTIINHITGRPMLRMPVFYRFIILKFFKSWNVLKDTGDMVPINNETVSKMHDVLVKSLCKKWLKMTSGSFEE